MTKNPIFSLRNFRSFGENGANFELAPITVLTGCNSAGKSTLVKALMLLSEENPSDLKLSSRNLCLGGYKTVANKNGEIVFSYRIWSSDLQEDLVVTRCFRLKQKDVLNEGTLYSLIVKKIDGTVVFEEKEGFSEYKTDSIKNNFYRFYNVCCAIDLLKDKLPLIKKWEREKTHESFIKKTDNVSIQNLVNDRLSSVGITMSEAVILWNEFNKKLFLAVINSKYNHFLNPTEIISFADVAYDPEENEEWEEMMKKYLDGIVNDVCSPFFIKKSMYVNSSSAIISRLYFTEDENKISKALRDFNKRTIEYNNEYIHVPYSYKPGSFMNKWINMFGIGDRIQVKGTDETHGLMIYLYKGTTKRLLADEGYGITQLISLLLQIDTNISICPQYNHKANINKDENEVYFSDDIKPVMYLPQTICVEEPEIHLHPKYQSLLAEMFVEAYQKYNIHFIIETHSEYLIRKLQVMVADKQSSLLPQDVSLNYVEKDDNGVSTNRKIEILEDGRLSEPFGPGFYDQATGLSMSLLKMKMDTK